MKKRPRAKRKRSDDYDTNNNNNSGANSDAETTSYQDGKKVCFIKSAFMYQTATYKFLGATTSSSRT